MKAWVPNEWGIRLLGSEAHPSAAEKGCRLRGWQWVQGRSLLLMPIQLGLQMPPGFDQAVDVCQAATQVGLVNGVVGKAPCRASPAPTGACGAG
ncbi:hypothetical protein STPYR_11558 [uncultured Stenotrophomonas sp.]|uniref:Uncharacterized protein n=1 Tax=uncultured Stenotrophomonas sp. TaxID=165438 RepID=A0A1Y5Q2X5_9GAMM|nr:hypothetical protein STPYR_11558 [uncultured Stenotrophomonas sp.]